ncbi:MAG: hypothetical protein COB26_09740 [Piscirickettsiaceae bacterium]|nr:MAG: hypothetical protein COB26_09740 [Piscirickettsiaceae bacterium]
MDINFTNEHKALREIVRCFSETKLAPLVREAVYNEMFSSNLLPKWNILHLQTHVLNHYQTAKTQYIACAVIGINITLY